MHLRTRIETSLRTALTALWILGGASIDIVAQDAKKAAAPDPTSALVGNWSGSLDIGPVKLRLVFKVRKSADGELSATMDSPDQGSRDLPVTAILYNHPAVRMEMDGIAGVFKGDFNSESTEIKGTWEQGQGLKPMPLVLTRSTEVDKPAPKLDYEFIKGSAPDLRGYWTGSMTPAPGIDIRIGLSIGKAPDGSYGGTMDFIDQGARGIPINSIRVTKLDVQMEWTSFGMKFTGSLNADATELTGKFEQGGRPTEVKFARVEKLPSGIDFSTLSMVADAGKPDPRGYWRGELDFQTLLLTITVKIGRAKDGSYVAAMDVKEQGARNLPATSATVKDATVNLEWKGIAVVIKGDVNAEGNEIAGEFTQFGKSVPFTLARITEADAK